MINLGALSAALKELRAAAVRSYKIPAEEAAIVLDNAIETFFAEISYEPDAGEVSTQSTDVENVSKKAEEIDKYEQIRCRVEDCERIRVYSTDWCKEHHEMFCKIARASETKGRA